jgi:hypothetical protein
MPLCAGHFFVQVCVCVAVEALDRSRVRVCVSLACAGHFFVQVAVEVVAVVARGSYGGAVVMVGFV